MNTAVAAERFDWRSWHGDYEYDYEYEYEYEEEHAHDHQRKWKSVFDAGSGTYYTLRDVGQPNGG